MHRVFDNLVLIDDGCFYVFTIFLVQKTILLPLLLQLPDLHI